MRSILRQTLVAMLLIGAFFACAKTRTGVVELRSSGDIVVNQNGFDGSVHAGRQVLYTLKGINANQNYTLQTEIGLRSDGLSTTPDGTLTALIYESVDDFRNNPDAVPQSLVPQQAPNDNIYEFNFTAQSSGDYVVVISGESRGVPGLQFFYNLRLMSADPSAITAVLSPITSETVTTYQAVRTDPTLTPGFLNIYNGGDVASSGTYTLALVTNSTATPANPQIFVYKDSSLTVNSLILSSIPTTTEFLITSFDAGVPGIVTEQSTTLTNIISGVTFTSGSGGGPFIVLKGFVSAVTYTLNVGP